ncbi:hypothetical protein TNCV_3485631 [Trichonephila clavipes]|nr:hypothetical protein TNCV_3485631 [Trichonephila clavipes]
MRSTKELIKKDVLVPVKHNVFLLNLPDVEEVPSHDGETCPVQQNYDIFSSGLDEKEKKGGRTLPGQRTVRLADYGMQPKPSSLRAQAQLSETQTETCEL